MLQPRFGASFAMAFFSITLMLNLAGVDLRHLDLRPGALRNQAEHSYYATKTRVVRYYDSMRFVYELQARMRELSRMLPEENNHPEPQHPHDQDNVKKVKDHKDISVAPVPDQDDEKQAQHATNTL